MICSQPSHCACNSVSHGLHRDIRTSLSLVRSCIQEMRCRGTDHFVEHGHFCGLQTHPFWGMQPDLEISRGIPPMPLPVRLSGLRKPHPEPASSPGQALGNSNAVSRIDQDLVPQTPSSLTHLQPLRYSQEGFDASAAAFPSGSYGRE